MPVSLVARRALLAALAIVLCGAVVLVALPSGRSALADGVAWLRAAGAAGRLLAIAGMVVGVALGAPALWCAALIGYLFGVAAGLPISIAAALCGALAAFSMARWVLREEVARLVARRRRWHALVDAVGDGGWRLIVLLRLAGPHNILNIALAASPVTFREYAIGTFIGSLPSLTLGTVGGALATDAASLWKARSDLGPAWIALVVAGAIALTLAITLLVRLTRRHLKRLEKAA